MRIAKASLGLLSLAFASRISAQPNISEDNHDAWFRSPFTMFQTNLRDIDVITMDTDEVADYIKNHGANTWLQSIGGIIANYQSKLDFHYINPMLDEREGGDLVQDTIESAHARGIRVLGRMDFSKVQREIADAHPEWAYVSPNGTWQTHPRGLVSVCPSTEWYQNRTFDILEEIIDNYDVEGFFVNYAGYNENDYFRTYWGVCQCDSCQHRWSEYSGGKELPKWREDEAYSEWKLFSDGMLDKWTARVREFIVERVPDAALILGGAANVMFYEEANNAVGRDIWHHATAETVSKFFSWRPEVPVLVNCASFNDHAWRLSSEQTEHYVQFHLQAISRGANPSSYILGYPGQVPWPALSEAADIMRFHHRWTEVYTGFRQMAKMALVLPRLQNMGSEEQFEAAMEEYKGLYKALQEQHIPFEIIALQYLSDILERGGLDQWEVILLPNFGELDDEYVEGFDNYVRNGGTLITTGHVGASNNGTLQLESLPATRREKYSDEMSQYWSQYMAPEQQDPNHGNNSFYTAPLVPIFGSYSVYEWKNESRGIYNKLDNGTFAPPEYIYGNKQTEERGVGIGPYEDGTGVLIPFPVGMAYRDMGLQSHRDFFELILKEVMEEPQLRFDGLAEQVEVTLNRNARNQTVIHLLNMSGIKYQNFGKWLPIPASNITITGGGEGVAARALRANTTLEVEDGVIQLPGLGLFEVVVIQGLE